MRQLTIVEYERPTIDVVEVRVESTLLSGSNLENPEEGGQWLWD